MNAQEQIAAWKKIEVGRLKKAQRAWNKLHEGRELTKEEISITKDALKYYIMYTTIV